jgi:hypothetical protein
MLLDDRQNPLRKAAHLVIAVISFVGGVTPSLLQANEGDESASAVENCRVGRPTVLEVLQCQSG